MFRSRKATSVERLVYSVEYNFNKCHAHVSHYWTNACVLVHCAHTLLCETIFRNPTNLHQCRGEDPIEYQFLNRTFRVTPPGMQFGCVFIIFGSHTYHTSIPNTKSRRCRRTRTSEHKLVFALCAVQFHYILLYMSRCINMGLFQLFNSV